MRLGALVLFVSVIAACGPPTSTSNRSAARDGAASCTQSDQCLAQEQCVQNVCVSAESNNAVCVANSDRGQGERCQHGSCVADNSECRFDSDCGRHEACDNGMCVANESGCQRNADCERGEACRSGACVREQNSNDDCASNSDCADGQACRSGRCVTQQTAGGNACETHDQCAAGQACLQPQGVCGQWLGERCSSNNDCLIRDSQGQSTPGMCEQGVCRVDQFGSCEADGDCGGTYSCMTAGPNQMCLQGCQDSSVCDSNLKCDAEINACWYNLCGQPHELSESYQQVNNGNLGGSCDADGGGDGTCVEVDAGGNQWVGICIEGGNARVGDSCLFDAERTDDRNQCEGGSLCHFESDRDRGVCVASCSPDNGHGNVRCTGGTTCLAGRCLSREQQCDPGSQNACGSMGRCSLLSWGMDEGMCAMQEPAAGPAGSDCEKSTQCVDGNICLTLSRGEQAPTCHTLCRPMRGGQGCPAGTMCTGLGDLSGGQVTSNWGLCVPMGN